ncbi:hypothetical protein ACFC58_07060 [Kitasatospora purpeofusca]|uniref:hypothetical protein n=1 Tax=Kitasatospora purpeofusca TaxID=67352 RepID=UPI0035DB9671
MPRKGSAGRRANIKRLRDQYGVSHAEATQMNDRKAGPPRLILTPEILALGRGEGLPRNCRTDWVGWLKRLQAPGAVGRFTCDWCGERGDARTADTSVVLVLSTYDPDLNPVPRPLTTTLSHAACQGSELRWAVPVEVPREPSEVELTWAPLDESGRPDDGAAAFAVYRPNVAPLLARSSHGPVPILRFFTRHLSGTMGQAQQEQLWQDHLVEELGLGFVDAGDPYGWTVRVEHRTGSALAPSWISLRTSLEEDGRAARSLYTAVTELPDDWVAAARGRGEALVIATAAPWGPGGVGAGKEALYKRYLLGEVPGGWVPLCDPTSKAIDAWADARAAAEPVMG